MNKSVRVFSAIIILILLGYALFQLFPTLQKPITPNNNSFPQQPAAVLFGSPSLTPPTNTSPNIPGVATLPRVYMDTALVPSTGKVISVPAGGNLQAAINNALPGDVVELAAGAVFRGSFTLPNKSGSGWVTIRTSAWQNLPAPGSRVSPADKSKMAVLEGDGSNVTVLGTADGAHNYRIVGLEVRPEAGRYYNTLIGIGQGAPDSDAKLPSYIVFDRMYVHGDPTAGSRRGARMNGNYIAFIDSYVSDFKESGADSQALASWGGYGPIKITNNYLEASGENVIVGGAPTLVVGQTPSDVEIRGNYIYKPLSWKGSNWLIKNSVEIKFAKRVLIDGNIVENSWPNGQAGEAFNIKVSVDAGTGAWQTTQDITVSNNLVRKVSRIVKLCTGCDNSQTPTSRISVLNNLFIDVGATMGGDGWQYVFLGPIASIVVDHNTTYNTIGSLIVPDTGGTPIPASGFVYTNNIAPYTGYGIKGGGVGGGTATLAAFWPGYIFSKNVDIGAGGATLPPNNFAPANTSAVGYVNETGGDFHLSASSPYKNGGTDGKDIGADIDAINALTANVITGIYSGGGTYTPPTSTPAPTLNFSASPTTITTASAPTTLTWSSANASTCTASGGWSGSQPVSGSVSIPISNTTSFSLTCAGSSGSVTQNANVTYSPPTAPFPAPTVSFQAIPTSIVAGQSSTLTWSSTGMTSCVGSDRWGSGAKALSGTQIVTPTYTTNYTLTCTGTQGTRSAVVTVGVSTTPTPTPAPTLNFTVSPTSLTSVAPVTISWTSTNATSCSASGSGFGWTGTQPISGSFITQSIDANASFFLVCTGPSGSVTRSASVIYSPSTVPTPESTISLSVSPTSIPAGQSATLNWSSTNMTSCAASDGWSGTKALSGSEAVYPTVTTTYSLYCNSEAGTKSTSLTVNVSSVTTPPPTIGITTGDTIMVIVHRLNVRARPTIYAQRLGTQFEGSTGIVTEGPVSADGYTWWKVDFGYGVDGWVAEEGNIQESSPITPLAVGSPVTTTDTVNVRSTPTTHGNNKLGRQSVGSHGTIISGPISGSDYIWWRVDFLYEPDGWVVANYIR